MWARVRDLDTVDDLIQEALVRVIAARGRLEDERERWWPRGQAPLG
jgi:DNA-directed RNA polymerase specialized sigma24 family protein